MKLGECGFQRSHIPEVTGSSPVGPTNDFKGLGSLPNPVFAVNIRICLGFLVDVID